MTQPFSRRIAHPAHFKYPFDGRHASPTLVEASHAACAARCCRGRSPGRMAAKWSGRCPCLARC